MYIPEVLHGVLHPETHNNGFKKKKKTPRKKEGKVDATRQVTTTTKTMASGGVSKGPPLRGMYGRDMRI